MARKKMDLGTEFRIEFCPLSKNAAEFTIKQLIAALKATTTLTKLTLCFFNYKPTPARHRRIIEPLCRCLASLHEHHPLRTLRFFLALDMFNGMPDTLEQLLVAAKQSGIRNLVFYSCTLSIQFLVLSCRDSHSLKVLELENVTFSVRGAALPLPLNHRSKNNSVILTLDKLSLHHVSFANSAAATVFANLVAHFKVSSLSLGKVSAHDHDGIHITERILSELKIEQLTLYSYCRMEHFQAALDAGTTTVTDLDIQIKCDQDDTTARLELLASFLRRAVQLHSLTIRRKNSNNGPPQIRLPPHLFQAMESCTTVLQIQVIRDDNPDQVPPLQKITARNRELDRFATDPGSYPTQELPELLCQFDHCPTARFQLARGLLQGLSFAELYYARGRTNPPTRKKAKLE